MEQGARPVERSVRGVINRCSVWRRPRPRLPVGRSRGDRQVFAKKTPSKKLKRPRKRLKAAGSGPVSRPRHSCSLKLHAGTAEHPPGSYDAFGYISAKFRELERKTPMWYRKLQTNRTGRSPDGGPRALEQLKRRQQPLGRRLVTNVGGEGIRRGVDARAVGGARDEPPAVLRVGLWCRGAVSWWPQFRQAWLFRPPACDGNAWSGCVLCAPRARRMNSSGSGGALRAVSREGRC